MFTLLKDLDRSMNQEMLQKISRVANVVTAICAVIVAFFFIQAFRFISEMGEALADNPFLSP